MSLILLFQHASGVELGFWFAAIFGTSFFVFRVMLVLIGGISDGFDAGVDHGSLDHGSFDGTAGDAHHTEAAFKLISLNTVSAFLMMFGWSALTASLQYHLPSFLALVIGLVIGFFSMYVTALMYAYALKLASSGDDFSVARTVGLRGSVYQEIPKGGIGKVQVVVNDMTREINARAESHIKSFVPITVLKAIDDNTVLVKPINATGV